MSTNQLWETRPLEIWDRAKALRAYWQKSIDDSASNAKQLLAHGNTGDVSWRDYFVNLNIIEDNPVGAMMASTSDVFARKSRLASETRGWGREICGYVQNCWGAQFLGYQQDGSVFPYRDMCVPFTDPCDQHTKRGQQCMDLSPIPRWGGDWPMYLGEDDPERDKELIETRVWNTLKIIADIERIFDTEFDDESFINDVKSKVMLFDSGSHGIKIMNLMTRIPSPLSQKDLYSFYTLGGLTRLPPDVIGDFWQALVDEIQWRADNQIAAVANERYRYMEAHPSPWHFLKYMRYLEQYGAVCIGSQYSQLMAGPVYWNRESQQFEPRTIREPGKEAKDIKTREDAIRFVLTEARGHRFKDDEYFRKNAITDFAEGFKVNGAILALWRGGVGCTLTRKEQGLRLSDMGVRVLHYEGSQPGDRTDLDEKRFLDQLDEWMESQGLRKISQ
ncbi:MAG: 2-hydroxyacyl-CoA dehydratase [Oscillospiraceae bacterium]|nr:2-hydroxyacyl-CoA dehydratase [Oscillospiraceae bacterium]